MRANLPSRARLLASVLLTATVIAVSALVYFRGFWSALRILGIVLGVIIVLLLVISALAGPDYPSGDEFE
jgi:hypothetical protein